MKRTDREAARRLQLLAEMQELGISMMRRKLARKHPEASEAEIARMLSDWLGGTPQPRDVGGGLAVSRSPRFTRAR
jgi:hypothetical protein